MGSLERDCSICFFDCSMKSSTKKNEHGLKIGQGNWEPDRRMVGKTSGTPVVGGCLFLRFG